MDTINEPILNELVVPCPPANLQNRIADFLDAETARIDSLIKKKRHLSTTLAARSEGQIRELLRTEGWPWLALKRRWSVIDCKHRTPTYVETGYPVVSPGDVTSNDLDLKRCHRFIDEGDFMDLTEGSRQPKRGDIIYSRNASIGIACYVETDEPFCMGQDVCLITSTDQNQRFLSYALNTFGMDQLELTKVGSTFSRVNVERILEIKVPCPPPIEQSKTADMIRRIDEGYRQIMREIERSVDTLREYRSALITAAVTGHLDIPGVAA